MTLLDEEPLIVVAGPMPVPESRPHAVVCADGEVHDVRESLVGATNDAQWSDRRDKDGCVETWCGPHTVEPVHGPLRLR